MGDRYDVAVVGAGPAGSTCAALCAAGGLRVLLLERAAFPRDKVCGDCLNPACWPVLDRLEVSQRVLALPHSQLETVEFIGISGRTMSVPLRSGIPAEIAVRRSLFDELLCARAAELGAEVRENTTVTALEAGWTIRAGSASYHAARLVAADGRNFRSTPTSVVAPAPSLSRTTVAAT
jgi:flavin-dependent dehydrogenase